MIPRMTFKRFCIWLALIFLFLEAGFHFFDPFGVFAKEWMWRQLTSHFLEDETGYAIEAGQYAAHFTATILGDHSRLVSDSNWQSPCRIAFIGDSFTFGYGVDDNAVFVNLLARDLHLNARNYGQVAYNATQALQMRQRVQADGYIYLHIDNDYDRPRVFRASDKPAFQMPMLAMHQYYRWSHKDRSGIKASPYNSDYRQSLHILANDPTILSFAFDEEIGTRANDWYPSITLLDKAFYLEHHVSIADWHPNVEGHQLIADAMKPDVNNFVNRICT